MVVSEGIRVVERWLPSNVVERELGGREVGEGEKKRKGSKMLSRSSSTSSTVVAVRLETLVVVVFGSGGGCASVAGRVG